MHGNRRLQVTSIEIRAAHTHSLEGIDIDVPKHRLVAFTGVISASPAIAAAFSTWSSLPQLAGASDTTTLPERMADIVSPGVTATGASSGLGLRGPIVPAAGRDDQAKNQHARGDVRPMRLRVCR